MEAYYDLWLFCSVDRGDGRRKELLWIAAMFSLVRTVMAGWGSGRVSGDMIDFAQRMTGICCKDQYGPTLLREAC